MPKNQCFWTVVLETTLECPLDCKEIQPVHPKGNQFWIFIERTDAEAETPILWPLDAKNWHFKLRCWRRLLRVPWAARSSNESILKKINSEYSLEGLILKLKLQYFGTWCKKPTHWKRPWCWERLKAKGEEDSRGRDVWIASLTQWTWIWANCGRQWRTGKPGMLIVHGVKELEMT